MLTTTFSAPKFQPILTELSINRDEQQLQDSPPKKIVEASNFCVKATNCHCLEAFIEKTEQSIFHTKNVNSKVFHNITKKEREVLKEMKPWENCCVRVQDKGSRFFMISNDEYYEKVSTQIGRSSFIQLPHDITKSFENKVNNYIKKWEDLRVFDKK